MEIRAITPTIPAAPATPAAVPAPGQGVPNTKPPPAVERNLHDTSVGPARAASASRERPQVAHTHTELTFDETLNRIVGRVIDETTGETILEIPPEQLKALFTKMREQLGPLVDGSA